MAVFQPEYIKSFVFPTRVCHRSLWRRAAHPRARHALTSEKTHPRRRRMNAHETDACSECDEVRSMALRRAELPASTSLCTFVEYCGNDFCFEAHARPATNESRSGVVIFATPPECKNDEVVFLPLDQLGGLYVGFPLVPDESIESSVCSVLLRPASHKLATLARAYGEFLGGRRETSNIYGFRHDDTYLLPRMRALAALEPYEVPLPLTEYVTIQNVPDNELSLGPARLAEVRA